MNLRKPVQFGREAAHICGHRAQRLARPEQSISMTCVVAPLGMGGALTSPYRYPSPFGRIGVPQGHPPIFFHHQSRDFGWRAFADVGGCDDFVLDKSCVVALSGREQTKKTRGKQKCRNYSNFRSLARLLSVFPAVAIRLVNKRLSAQVPVLALRRLPEQALRQVQRLASRPTLCIASNTHRVANLASIAAFEPPKFFKTTGAAMRRWFFVAKSIGPIA